MYEFLAVRHGVGKWARRRDTRAGTLVVVLAGTQRGIDNASLHLHCGAQFIDGVDTAPLRSPNVMAPDIDRRIGPYFEYQALRCRIVDDITGISLG